MAGEFFVRDCNGKIVGNPKGYKSIESATKQKNTKGSKLYNAIWSSFVLQTEEQKKVNQHTVWSVGNGGQW